MKPLFDFRIKPIKGDKNLIHSVPNKAGKGFKWEEVGSKVTPNVMRSVDLLDLGGFERSRMPNFNEVFESSITIEEDDEKGNNNNEEEISKTKDIFDDITTPPSKKRELGKAENLLNSLNEIFTGSSVGGGGNNSNNNPNKNEQQKVETFPSQHQTQTPFDNFDKNTNNNSNPLYDVFQQSDNNNKQPIKHSDSLYPELDKPVLHKYSDLAVNNTEREKAASDLFN